MRLLLCCLLLALCAPSLAEPWQVVGDKQFAPYSYVAPDDDAPLGLDVELVDAVLQAAGVDYHLRLYPWLRVKAMLERGEATMAFQFAGTPERQAQYRLVGPLRTGTTVFMTTSKAALEDWRQLSDLAPYRIGQIEGYAYETAFDRAELRRDAIAQSPRQLVAMLLAGRFDVIVGDRTQLLYFAREQNAEQRVRVLPRPLVQMPRYVAFGQEDYQRAELFADALERLQNTGELEAIYQRWEH
ncbi:substrate-binding periplasmic protein [Pseudomonas sp. MBLB4123]|uniref:substrate-binding periplasmic protein n=1 Tax=Pseudomonas sp. MBLB4123 TaxID=3451557 RepID=UPI003F7510E9